MVELFQLILGGWRRYSIRDEAGSGKSDAAPTGQRALPADTQAPAAQQYRSPSVGLALSLVPLPVPTQNSETPNSLEILAAPPYRRGHDHDSFRTRFTALLPCS
jgi:hypothetical protein